MWVSKNHSLVLRHSSDSNLSPAKQPQHLDLWADHRERLDIWLKPGGVEEGIFSIHLSAKRVNSVFTDLKASSGETCETQSIIY